MLSRQVVALGLADRVVIEAATGREAVAEELARASVVVSLSEYESQGLAVHEALALGRPTIVRDGTALGELVRAGAVRGLPADASRAEIAAAILAELEAPTRLTHASMPSWDDAAERLADLYVRVAGERQKSAVLSA
jgi:glycosyltransferase involved in cell wall biosynthesis